MPYLDHIVALVNSRIADKVDAEKVRLSINGISKPMVSSEEDGATFPALVDNKGQGEFKMIDDTHTICIYHKCDAIDYEASEVEFGTPGNIKSENATMRLICWANRRLLDTTQEWLASVVASSFPSRIGREFYSNYEGLIRARIELGPVDNDTVSVWGTEFTNLEYQLPSDSILFSIGYNIVTDFNEKCLRLCEEC